MATVMPQQVVDPRARLAVHVEVRAAEEVRLHHHVVQVERTLLDAAPDLAVGIGEAARVRDHQHRPRLLLRIQHLLRVRQSERHRDFYLNVLALREREHRLLTMLIARRRQNDRVDAGTVDALFQVRGGERDIPLRRELFRACLGAPGNRNDLHTLDLGQSLGVDFPHRARASQTNLQRQPPTPNSQLPISIPPGVSLGIGSWKLGVDDGCIHPSLPMYTYDRTR
jgi:hypothetical protein